MTNKSPMLMATLFAQLFLSILWFASEDKFSVYQANENLLDLKLSSIDTITIRNSDQQQLGLQKVGKQWQVPDYYRVVVDDHKFTKVIDDLLTIKTNWPIASTTEAATRFKVAEDKFETQIVFKKQDQIIDTIFLGTAPSFRKVHLRKAGQDEIYSLELNTYEFSTAGKDWMSKDLLKFDSNEKVKIKSNDLVLLHQAGKWLLEDQAENQKTLQEPTKTLINQLSNLSYTEIIGDSLKDEYGFSEPDLVIAITDKADNSHKLIFAKSEDGNYIGKSSDYPYYFKVSEYSFQAILDTTPASLIAEIPDDKTQESGSPAATEEIAAKENTAKP